MRISWIMAAFAAAVLVAQDAGACGTPVELATHDDTRTLYVMAGPTKEGRGVLLLLPGGGGFLDFDGSGCPQKLGGNSLVEMQPLFHTRGFATALLDAPSDHHGGDGLGGFRIDADHAHDIGIAIADVRRRTDLPVWLVGTSRGTISAINAATRLETDRLPDGVILTSPITQPRDRAYKAWVTQSVFSFDLENIRIPILVIAHEADKCVRTPADRAGRITEATASPREQTVIMTGGPGWQGPTSVKACRGKAPHGFIQQREDVADGIARFVAGERF